VANGSTGDANGKLSVRDVLVLLTAVGAGGLGTYGYQQISPPRPDPFTGTMAKEMEIRLRHDMERIETQLLAHINVAANRMVEHDKDIATLKERCRERGEKAFKDR